MKFEEYAPEANTFLKEVAEELGQLEDTDHAWGNEIGLVHG